MSHFQFTGGKKMFTTFLEIKVDFKFLCSVETLIFAHNFLKLRFKKE